MTEDDGLNADDGTFERIAAAAAAVAEPEASPAPAPAAAKRGPGRPITHGKYSSKGKPAAVAAAAPAVIPAAGPVSIDKYEEPINKLMILAAGLVDGGGIGSSLPPEEREAVDCIKVFGLAVLAKYAPGFRYVEEAGLGASVLVLIGLRVKRVRARSHPRAQGERQDAPPVQSVAAA